MTRSTAALIVAVSLSAAAGFGAYRGWLWWTDRPVDGRWEPPPAASAAVKPAAHVTAATAATVDGPSDGDNAPTPTTIPEAMPDLKMPDLDGKPHALRGYLGKPTVYNFWASWCAPCRREIPLLNRIHAQADKSAVNIVGIAADVRENIVEFLKTTQVDYPVLVGEQEGSEAAQQLGVPLVLPFSVFVASDGRVVALKLGELHQDEATAMLAGLRRLDQGRATLAETRQTISERLRQLAAERALRGAGAG